MKRTAILVTLGRTLGTSSTAVVSVTDALIAAVSPAAPAVLPGRGLVDHDFFHAGEAKDRRAFIVRKSPDNSENVTFGDIR